MVLEISGFCQNMKTVLKWDLPEWSSSLPDRHCEPDGLEVEEVGREAVGLEIGSSAFSIEEHGSGDRMLFHKDLAI